MARKRRWKRCLSINEIVGENYLTIMNVYRKGNMEELIRKIFELIHVAISKGECVDTPLGKLYLGRREVGMRLDTKVAKNTIPPELYEELMKYKDKLNNTIRVPFYYIKLKTSDSMKEGLRKINRQLLIEAVKEAIKKAKEGSNE